MTRWSRIWYFLTVPCEEVVRLVSSSFETPLTRSERSALKVHMIYCTACRRFRKQITALREAIQRHQDLVEQSSAPEAVLLSDAAKARIKEALPDNHT